MNFFISKVLRKLGLLVPLHHTEDTPTHEMIGELRPESLTGSSPKVAFSCKRTVASTEERYKTIILSNINSFTFVNDVCNALLKEGAKPKNIQHSKVHCHCLEVVALLMERSKISIRAVSDGKLVSIQNEPILRSIKFEPLPEKWAELCLLPDESRDDIEELNPAGFAQLILLDHRYFYLGKMIKHYDDFCALLDGDDSPEVLTFDFSEIKPMENSWFDRAKKELGVVRPVFTQLQHLQIFGDIHDDIIEYEHISAHQVDLIRAVHEQTQTLQSLCLPVNALHEGNPAFNILAVSISNPTCKVSYIDPKKTISVLAPNGSSIDFASHVKIQNLEELHPDLRLFNQQRSAFESRIPEILAIETKNNRLTRLDVNVKNLFLSNSMRSKSEDLGLSAEYLTELYLRTDGKGISVGALLSLLRSLPRLRKLSVDRLCYNSKFQPTEFMESLSARNAPCRYLNELTIESFDDGSQSLCSILPLMPHLERLHIKTFCDDLSADPHLSKIPKLKYLHSFHVEDSIPELSAFIMLHLIDPGPNFIWCAPIHSDPSLNNEERLAFQKKVQPMVSKLKRWVSNEFGIQFIERFHHSECVSYALPDSSPDKTTIDNASPTEPFILSNPISETVSFAGLDENTLNTTGDPIHLNLYFSHRGGAVPTENCRYFVQTTLSTENTAVAEQPTLSATPLLQESLLDQQVLGMGTFLISREPLYLPALTMRDKVITYSTVPTLTLVFCWNEGLGQWGVKHLDTADPSQYVITLKWLIQVPAEPIRPLLHVEAVADFSSLLQSSLSQLRFEYNEDRLTHRLMDSESKQYLQGRVERRDVLKALHRYCTAFTQAPLSRTSTTPLDSLNLLLQEQKGVCRHRARVFYEVAKALGFPCRFIENVLHAFVEVCVDDKWVAYELGGGSFGAGQTFISHTMANPSAEHRERIRASNPFLQPKIRPTLAHLEASFARTCTTSSNNLQEIPSSALRAPSPHVWGEGNKEGSYSDASVRAGSRCVLVNIQGGDPKAPYGSAISQRLGNERCYVIHTLDVFQYDQILTPSGCLEGALPKRVHLFIDQAKTNQHRHYYLILEESVMEDYGFHSLFDTPRRVGDMILPDNIIVTLLVSESTLKTRREDLSFCSRFENEIDWAAEVAPPSDAMDEEGTIRVDLSMESSIWGNQVLGYYQKNRDGFQWVPGALQQALETDQRLHLLNPPDVTSFRTFMSDLQSGQIVIRGVSLRAPSFTIEHKPILFNVPPDATVRLDAQGTEWDQVLTTENTGTFFNGGWIAQKRGQALYIALDDATPDETIYRLVMEAIVNTCELHLIFPSLRTVPLFLKDFPQRKAPELKPSKKPLTMMNAPADHMEQLSFSCNYRLALHSEETQVFLRYEKTSDGRYVQVPTPLARALLKGATIVLYGRPSPTVMRHLAWLLARTPGLYVNDDFYPVKGRVTLLLDASHNPAYIPTNFIQNIPTEWRSAPPRSKDLSLSVLLLYHPIVQLIGPRASGKTTAVNELDATVFQDFKSWLRASDLEGKYAILHLQSPDQLNDLKRARALYCPGAFIQEDGELIQLGQRHRVVWEGPLDRTFLQENPWMKAHQRPFEPLSDALLKQALSPRLLDDYFPGIADFLVPFMQSLSSTCNIIHVKTLCAHYEALRDQLEPQEALLLALDHVFIFPANESKKATMQDKVNTAFGLENYQEAYADFVNTIQFGIQCTWPEEGPILTSSRLKLLTHIHLNLSTQRAVGFDNLPPAITLIEGPSGIGKSCLLRAYLKGQGIPYLHCGPEVSLNDLRQAASANKLILIDELNTCAPHKRQCILKLLENTPVIGTQNSAKQFKGRAPWTDAPLCEYFLEEYKPAELFTIARVIIPDSERAQALVRDFTQAQSVEKITFRTFMRSMQALRMSLDGASKLVPLSIFNEKKRRREDAEASPTRYSRIEHKQS